VRLNKKVLLLNGNQNSFIILHLMNMETISLTVGDIAPVFAAKNQDGKVIALEDFRGKKLILYFYPKDNTPGCTAEACSLNEGLDSFAKLGIEVVGVSPDKESSHLNFRAKYNLRFNLVADTDTSIAKMYGAWGEKDMYGKKYEGILRTTFVIDETGKIAQIIKKVDTKDHSLQIRKILGI